jgi:hypothetical protein
MIFIASEMTATEFLETVSIKSVDDITQGTIDLINYYGKNFTDTQKLLMDSYFEGVKAQSYSSKIVHSMYPFLVPNMTGAEIDADKTTANKAFYCPFTDKLPDAASDNRMWGTVNAPLHSITDLGILQNTMIPTGSSNVLRPRLETGVTDANNYSAGLLTNADRNAKIGDWSFRRTDDDSNLLRMGSSSNETNFNIANEDTLLMGTHSSTVQADTIVVNNGNVINTNTYASSNQDTEITTFTIFNPNEDNSGKTFSFAFLANRMTPAELQDFYTKTLDFLNGFNVSLV